MYNSYYNQQQPYYSNQNQNYSQPQVQQQQMQPSMNFIPMYFVSSEEDVKKYIVMPNQIAYFKDMNSNIIYEKKADNFSNYMTKKYEMRDLSLPTQEYATKGDVLALRQEIVQMLGVKTNEQ